MHSAWLFVSAQWRDDWIRVSSSSKIKRGSKVIVISAAAVRLCSWLHTHTLLYLLCARETGEEVSRRRAPATSSSGIIFPWLTVATTTLPAFKLIIFIFFFWGCYCICKCRFVFVSGGGGGCQVASLAAASISISDFYLRRLLLCRAVVHQKKYILWHSLAFLSHSFISCSSSSSACLPTEYPLHWTLFDKNAERQKEWALVSVAAAAALLPSSHLLSSPFLLSLSYTTHCMLPTLLWLARSLPYSA